MIRKYTKEDYKTICNWWESHNEPIPPMSLVSEHTYILENSEGTPWICLSLIAFNTPWIAWSAGLVSNPSVDKAGRKEAVKELWDYIANVAKDMGYTNLLCIAPNEALEKRYEELGFVVTKRNQTFMIKRIGE